MATGTRRKPPLGELGAPGITSSIDGWIDNWEETPELRWPNNTRIYDRMRIDGHLTSGLKAVTLPIRRSSWDLAPDPDVRPEVAQLVRQDLGIAEKGKRLRRRRGGVVFRDLMRHALLDLVFGHMVFEQVYDLPGDGLAHLRKLAPRMPRTIVGWDIAGDGGLQAVKQVVPRPNGMWDEVRIPVDRLVVFVNEREGSDFTGQSILRPAYIHWRIKQDLVKVDAMAGERNGMGVPVVTYDPNEMSAKQALDIASNVRAGEFAAAAFPDGQAKLELLGVEGQVRDILASIRYHDQEMGRLMLAMFMDLGHDNGARSLGDSFVEFFVMALQSVADELAETITEHIIRDLVEINYGPDEPYPVLQCDEITADSALTADALKALADGGFIIPDPAIEEYLRRVHGLPESSIAAPPGIAPRTPVDVSDDPTVDPGTVEELEARLARLKAGPRAVPSRP